MTVNTVVAIMLVITRTNLFSKGSTILNKTING